MKVDFRLGSVSKRAEIEVSTQFLTSVEMVLTELLKSVIQKQLVSYTYIGR